MVAPSRRYLRIVVLVLAIAVAACSDDSNPIDNGKPDTTAPTVSAVTPVDAFHFDVTFSEEVTRASSENVANYVIIETGTALRVPAGPHAAQAPDDTLRIASAVLKANQTTASIATVGNTGGVSYRLSISGVADIHGNVIDTPVEKSFTGSGDPDVTAPKIVSRTPAPNATAVPVGTAVTLRFSEAISHDTFVGGVTLESDAGPVSWSLEYDYAQFVLTPLSPLATATQYTVTLSGVEDYSGVAMAATSWSFTTSSIDDTGPPTLVSSAPAQLATNVDVNSNLSLTFSEEMNQVGFYVEVGPWAGAGVTTWSNAGKTFTFNPDSPLLANQQYAVTIYPGSVRDLAGNAIVGMESVVFTTGSAVENGSIAGTLTGDPGSAASDPTGAIVIAVTAPFFNALTASDLMGSAVVADNDTYTMSHLPDGAYYPFAVLDSNGDGVIDPYRGDAIGGYGMDLNIPDRSQDTVSVAGGSHATGINFPLVDTSAITGTVEYTGDHSGGTYTVSVGAFDVSGFNPTNTPVSGFGMLWPVLSDWYVNSLYGMLPDGDYYVGAYLDLNDNYRFDLGVDPVGFYGGLPTPTAVHIENGSDKSGIVIVIEDAATATQSASVVWPTAKHNAKFERLFDAVRQSQAAAKTEKPGHQR